MKRQRRAEERERRAEEQEKTREQEAEQEKEDTEEERIEESRDKVHELRELEYEPTYSNTEVGNGVNKPREGEDYRIREPNNSTTHPAPSTLHEHVWFDWATNDDESIGPVPSPSDFHPATPSQPTPSPRTRATCLQVNKVT